MYDRRLTFTTQASDVIKKTRGRLKILKTVAGTDWGFGKNLLKCTYTALIISVLEYGSPAWWPWLSKTNKERMEKVQRAAARIIVGAVASSPVEALMAEAGLDTLEDRAEILAAVAYEKSLYLGLSNPPQCEMRWRSASVTPAYGGMGAFF